MQESAPGPEPPRTAPRRLWPVLLGAAAALLLAVLLFQYLPTTDAMSEHSKDGRKANRLIDEKSPYLQQHAYNPVDWYPWGDEAFDKARREDKPIFLSIGYSTCHWCHVMERESFEDDSIAALLNEFFVPVKVDREERPDVDRIYMNAVQAMTGQGGWPLNAFLTPDLEPFYGGTYFPPRAMPGRPGMMELLPSVQNAWTNRRDEIEQKWQADHAGARGDDSAGHRHRPNVHSSWMVRTHTLRGRTTPNAAGSATRPSFRRLRI